MAYTKAPVSDTHNIVRLPATGQAFVVSDPIQDTVPSTLNYLDCFPLSEHMWNGEPRQTIQRRECFEYAAAASGTISTTGVLGKSLVMAPDYTTAPNVFFAKNSNYYMFNYGTKVVSSVTTSTTATFAQYAYGTVAVDNTNTKRICYLDPGDELKTWLQDGTSVTTTTTGRGLDGRKGLVFLNSYLFAVDSTGYKIHNSTVGGVLTTWAATDYIAAEQYADPVLWIDKHKNMLVAFGSESVEFFADGGVEVGSPLVRQENYARQIGIYVKGMSYPGKYTCHIEDDIYFLGTKGETDSIGLYRIRNFNIEEVTTQYVQNILNYSVTDPKTDFVQGVEVLIINNNPMVLINIRDSTYSVCYFPQEDSWWLISNGNPTSYDFPDYSYRAGVQFFSQDRGFPMFIGQLDVTTNTLYYWNPDFNKSHILTSYIYTPIADLGINYLKHIARVDAIGDFGSNNTLTLGYNNSPNYEQAYTDCTYTRTPGTIGYQNNISWYNLGAWRRGSFRIKITGYDHWVYEGLDLEYNVGQM